MMMRVRIVSVRVCVCVCVCVQSKALSRSPPSVKRARDRQRRVVQRARVADPEEGHLMYAFVAVMMRY
jgi:hypothetical protein